MFSLRMCERDKQGNLTGRMVSLETSQAWKLERFHDKHCIKADRIVQPRKKKPVKK